MQENIKILFGLMGGLVLGFLLAMLARYDIVFLWITGLLSILIAALIVDRLQNDNPVKINWFKGKGGSDWNRV